MLYDEGLDDGYGGQVIHTIDPSTNTIHVQDGRHEYDPREGSSHMEEGHYQIIPEAMVEYHDEHHLNGNAHHHLHAMHHLNERGQEMIGEEVEMEEMEEVIDETTGQRMLMRPDGSMMYHPDDFVDDGSTTTWRLVDEDGSAVDMGAIAPLEMVHHQSVSFDVSAYEVCDSVSSSRNVPSRHSRGRQMLYRRHFPHSNQRFARLDRPASAMNPRHARVSRIESSRGRGQGKTGGGSRNAVVASSSSSSLPRLILPPPPPLPRRVPRRPTTKLTTQAHLVDATSGLETANCNYCHLRFYLPRAALRSRISYGTVESQFELPNAFFECPICGMESASGFRIFSFVSQDPTVDGGDKSYDQERVVI